MATPVAAIAEAVKDVAVEAAEDIAKGILKEGSKDLKSIENSVAKEAVNDDVNSSFLEKVEGAAQIVANEVVKGAQNVVTAVEEHPELLAEGALAIAVGAVSLIQPELLAAEVAIIGKMAGDSAKATLTQIAKDEGTKVVQAISKDALEDAKKIEEAHETAEEAEKKIEEGAEKIVGDIKATASTEEKRVVDAAHEGLSAAGATALGSAIAANVSSEATEDQVVTLELEQPDKGDETAHNPITLKITVGADGQVKGVAQTVVDEETPKTEEVKKEESKTGDTTKEEPPLVKAEENKDTKTEDVKSSDTPKVIEDSKPAKSESAPIQAKEALSDPSKATDSKVEETLEVEQAKPEIKTVSDEEKPISLNVTIAADGHVESVTQTIVEPKLAPFETGKADEVKSKGEEPEETKSAESKVDETKKDVSESDTPAPVEPVIEEPKSLEASESIEEAPKEAAEPTVQNESLIEPTLAAQSLPVQVTEKPVISEPTSSPPHPESASQHILDVPTMVPEPVTVQEESLNTIQVPFQVPAVSGSLAHVYVSHTPEPISEVKSTAAQEDKVSEPEMQKPEEPVSDETIPSKAENEVSAMADVTTPVVEKESGSPKEEEVSKPYEGHVETKSTPERAQIDKEKPVIDNTVGHAESEKKKVSIPVDEVSVKETELQNLVKEGEALIKPNISESKPEATPVEKKDEPETIDEESAAKEVSVIEPEVSETKVDEVAIDQKSEETATTNESATLPEKKEAIPEAKEEAVSPTDEVKEVSIEKSEPSVEKDESIPVIEPTKVHQVEEPKSNEPVELPASSREEEASTSKDIIEGVAPVAILAAAAMAHHKSTSKDHTNGADISSQEEPIKKKPDTTSKEVVESTRVDSAPLDPEIVHQKQEVVAPKPEEPIVQTDNASVEPEIKREEPMLDTSEPEIAPESKSADEKIKPKETPAASQSLAHVYASHTPDSIPEVKLTAPTPIEPTVEAEDYIQLPVVEEVETVIESDKTAPVQESTVLTMLEEVKQDLPEPILSSANTEAIHESAVSEILEQTKEISLESIVEPGQTETSAPVIREPVAIENLKEQVSEPIVQPSQTETSAPVVQEAVVTENLEEQVSEPIVPKSIEESVKEEIELPLTVEHVSEPDPVEKTEPEPKPSTSSEVQATEDSAKNEVQIPLTVEHVSEAETPLIEKIEPKAEESKPEESATSSQIKATQELAEKKVQLPLTVEHVSQSDVPSVEKSEPKVEDSKPETTSEITATEEPAKKEVQLPLIVEHVSQADTPSIEDFEPKADDSKTEPEPTPSSEIKATEIAVPVLAAAPVISAGVAKAISPASETVPRSSSPTTKGVEPVVAKEVESVPKAAEPVVAKEIESTSEAPEPVVVKEVESSLKPSEPIITKEAQAIDTKPSEPIIPMPTQPITTETPETHESNPVKVTIKSVEHVKSPPSTSSLEPPKAIDTLSKSVDTASVSLVSATATPTSPTSKSTAAPVHKHAKKGSIWRYLWPFGGGSTKPAVVDSKDGDKVVEAGKKDDGETEGEATTA